MYLQDSLDKVNSNQHVIEVFGLGYVGFPLAVRLAISGHKVFGIDTDSKKIENLKKNFIMTSHHELAEAFSSSIQSGNFIPVIAPEKSNLPKVGIICVPTPIPDGKNNSETYVFSAVKNFLDTAKKGDIIILESSVRVGTTNEVIKMIENRGYTVGVDFGAGFCPERIDPLNQKWKLENIPRVIFASDDITFEISKKIYSSVNNSNLHRVSSPKVAEAVKSFENTFRLVNISLVNELAILCDKLGISVNEVMSAASTKPFGFMPFTSGAGVGGHCVPKDPTFLLDSGKQIGMNFSSIENALEINTMIPKYVAESIQSILQKYNLTNSVLICGLAYKPDIEDMRDSPGFKIANNLAKRNIETIAYDPYYDHNLEKKYLIENNLEKLNFKIINTLDDEFIKNFGCICIVQHHTKIKNYLDEIYKKSLVQFIYDCQNQMSFNPKSKTILRGLGSNSLTFESFSAIKHVQEKSSS